MNFKKILISGAAGALMFGSLAVGAFASPQGQNLNASKCVTSGKPIVNVTFKVLNDADSGVGLSQAWALDNFNRRVQVWDQGNGTFCAISQYDGQFVTYGGTTGPDGSGTLGAGIKGTAQGGYTALFSGVFHPTLQTNGNIGTYDYACDQNFNCTGSQFSWISSYFTSAPVDLPLTYWSWTYRAGNNGTWVNQCGSDIPGNAACLGNSGNITGN